MLPSLKEIAKKRRQLGIKQLELAKFAGVSQSLIAKLETGKLDPSYNKAKKIFEALDRFETKSKLDQNKSIHNEVLSVQKYEPIVKVVQIMKKYGYSQIPVFNGKQSIGSITEKTILRQILNGKEISEITMVPAEKIMEEAFPQVNEDAPLNLITNLLQVYSAVLVSRKGEIVGIITKADLLRIL